MSDTFLSAFAQRRRAYESERAQRMLFPRRISYAAPTGSGFTEESVDSPPFYVSKGTGALQVSVTGGYIYQPSIGKPNPTTVAASGALTVANDDYVWVEYDTGGPWQITKGATLPVLKPYFLLAKITVAGGLITNILHYWSGGDLVVAQEVLFGKPYAAWDGTSALVLVPCSIDGTATGQNSFTPDINGSLVAIDQYNIGLGSVSTGCTLPTTAIVAYVRNAAVETYTVLGEITVQVVQERYDDTTHYQQAKVQFTVGGAKSTVSDWLNVRACTQVTAITAWQVDGTSGEVQKKTQAFYAPEVGSESGWTKINDTTESKPASCTAQAS
jgi:hypothetical protein